MPGVGRADERDEAETDMPHSEGPPTDGAHRCAGGYAMRPSKANIHGGRRTCVPKLHHVIRSLHLSRIRCEHPVIQVCHYKGHASRSVDIVTQAPISTLSHTSRRVQTPRASTYAPLRNLQFFCVASPSPRTMFPPQRLRSYRCCVIEVSPRESIPPLDVLVRPS